MLKWQGGESLRRRGALGEQATPRPDGHPSATVAKAMADRPEGIFPGTV
jgi:hypothetical protein